MKKNILVIIFSAILLTTPGCKDFLNQGPENILEGDEIFTDANMIKSVLANLYGRVTWGTHVADWGGIVLLDDAIKSDGGPDIRSTFDDDMWRTYDYGLIRNINQFLVSLKETQVLGETEKKELEGEVRFLRAWTYFYMCRSMGGMPIVYDEVFEYEAGMDVTVLQYPRSTEAELYDYIIEECEEIARFMSVERNTNSARANKWTALMLKARAAIYAGSISNYNNKMTNPIRTAGGEVGIPADRAQGYYETALKAAEEVINNGGYFALQTNANNPGRNFYEAVCVKDNNTEVIWARDYIYPGDAHQFTTNNIPVSHAEEIDRAWGGPTLNLVEAFEYTDNRNGELNITDSNGNYVFYDNAEDLFAGKDARLWGSVIYPGSEFDGGKSGEVVLQAGQLIPEGSRWRKETSDPDLTDDDGLLITSANGPVITNNQYINKAGFFFRKYLDENPGANLRGQGSEMWYPRFRMAEAYLIAAEAAMELNDQAKAVKYINEVRKRANIQELTVVTLDDIIRERQVEFAFEDHRYYDLKRWRKAHEVWNGVTNDPVAQKWALFPYKVNAPGNPNDGKWVFEKQVAHMNPYPLYFQLRHYYNFINQDWINNNPKLVPNPYQQ